MTYFIIGLIVSAQNLPKPQGLINVIFVEFNGHILRLRFLELRKLEPPRPSVITNTEPRY
jgi:hypothetical protein